MNKIYLGGNFKFSYKDYSIENLSNDYRSRILGDVNKLLHKPEGGLVSLDGGVSYCGPYYFYGDGIDGVSIVKNEYDMINDCTHAIFVVDNVNIPGTVTEIVHASLGGKKVIIFYVKQPLDAMEPEKSISSSNWYPIEFALCYGDAYVVECDDRDMAENLAYNYVESLKV